MLCGTYRPPDYNYEMLINYLEEKLENINNFNKKCWIMEDLNVDFLTNNCQKENLEILLQDNSFKNLNGTIPTRVPQHSETLIDYPITNNDTSEYFLAIVENAVSDHRLQICQVKTMVSTQANPTITISSKIYNSINLRKIETTITKDRDIFLIVHIFRKK